MQRDPLWGAVERACGAVGTPRPAALGARQPGSVGALAHASNVFPLWPQRCGAAQGLTKGPSSPGLPGRQPRPCAAGPFSHD